MFFEMRFDLGTLDSGERSLPFGLLVLKSEQCGFATRQGAQKMQTEWQTVLTLIRLLLQERRSQDQSDLSLH